MDLSRLGSVLLTRWGAATDVGPVRSSNEDSWLASPPLFAVADGMGGHVGGALASSTAVRTLESRLSADALGGRRADLADLDAGVQAAASAVAGLSDPADPNAAPGTTLTGAIALDTEEGPFWLTFNIGDSRTYIVGGRSIRQVTRDHSAVQEARDIAEVTGQELAFPPSNVVTRALGAGMAALPQADYNLVPLFQGDYAVICSDGVHGVLGDDQIHRIVDVGGEPQQIANELVDAAITFGTRDNTTAVVVHASRASRVGDDLNVHSRFIQAVRPASTTTARRVAIHQEED
ncbi:PP2C family protein-serine/threonine phosphatase [Schaalia vaccimaxillae]|uniref:PP2C family protein-serine/threonine phosphatase n=1 Tax=Schaalia vaccimaxillae TaxID=183916 RepID=UPI0003B642FE|nr:protein phosphatase 2C domain-containing protein [Schaalia vaccimaxillae]